MIVKQGVLGWIKIISNGVYIIQQRRFIQLKSGFLMKNIERANGKGTTVDRFKNYISIK